MSDYLSYNQIANGIVQLDKISDFPFHTFWEANPLQPWVGIDPRQGGYRPYKVTPVLEYMGPFDNPCAQYVLGPCDIVLPSSNCYQRTRQIIQQP